MMLLERWVVGTMLGFALTATAGFPGQSPTGKAQDKQPAKPTPELPPWDSAQPPPPIRPPSPEDSKPDPDQPTSPEDQPDAGQPGSADSTQKPDATQPAPPADSAKQPDATQPTPSAEPAPQAAEQQEVTHPEAAQPAPPTVQAQRKPAPMLPPSSDPAQRQMEKDTDQLLELSEDLKAEVDRAGSNTLSLAAVRKAEEIQRLVKSLKEQMRERGQIAVSKP
jgi:hypothetical protein